MPQAAPTSAVFALILQLGSPWALLAAPPEPSFRTQEIDSQIQIGYGLALEDVDGDGRIDILLADQRSVQWYQNPTWKKHLLCENLTERDNVCIAAKDLDGDGKAEIAIGAQWNPGETDDPAKSGGVFYLLPPDDRTQRWDSVKLHHEPTVHRMHWVQAPSGAWDLIVKPLHGRGNRNNAGAGSRVFAYRKPASPREEWKLSLVSDFTHASHNFHPIRWSDSPVHELLTAAKEGIFRFRREGDTWAREQVSDLWTGEIRDGRLPDGSRMLGVIEPMHGGTVAMYAGSPTGAGPWKRRLLDDSLKDGHAVVVADFLGVGSDQIVAGWRAMNPKGSPGVRLYTPMDASGERWRTTDLSGEAVAIEDIKSADLDGDGKPDLVLAGRQTKNLQILWNQTSPSAGR